MSNKNYIRGRALEYKVKQDFENKGFIVMRASGSHGIFDLAAFAEDYLGGFVWLIQCKTTKDKNTIKQLKKEFDKAIPFSRKTGFVQALAIKVHGTKEYTLYIPGDPLDE